MPQHFIQHIALLCIMNTIGMAQGINMQRYVLVIHGGAGTIDPKTITVEQENAYRKALSLALEKGYAVLKNGGTSLDAVEMAVRTMEDDSLFNAGRGSVFTHEGTIEMDAAIMNGDGTAGAVTTVSGIKNPISAARAVMEKSAHVLLSGIGAEQFAREQQLEFRDSTYFATSFRWNQLQRAKAQDKIELDHQNTRDTSGQNISPDTLKFGTVGAVALDTFGMLAAATSTGGLTNKRYNRIGDSPLIGCGTYAENGNCAISCTGQGEYFIRSVAAYDVATRYKYKGGALKTAVCETLEERIKPMGGKGGIIALSSTGEMGVHFTTKGMYRGWVNENGQMQVELFK